MAELHTTLYVQHPQQNIHTALKNLFPSINDKTEPQRDTFAADLVARAAALNPGQGQALAEALCSAVGTEWGHAIDLMNELAAETRGSRHGWHWWHFVHGSRGDDIMGAIVAFVGTLCPGVDVRACLCGDDDPWEIFYRWENGALVQQYYEPDYDETELPPVYLWWHEGLPDNIQEGFIHSWREDDA